MGYNYDKIGFPLQKISAKQKGKKWNEQCIDFVLNAARANDGTGKTFPKADMKAMYDLYNGKHDEKRLLYVTNPFKQVDSFPAKATNINILKPQIDTLMGELEGMPWNFMIFRTSDSAASEVQELLKDDLTNYMMSAMYANMDEDARLIHEEKLETGEIQLPESISDYYTKSYKDIAENITTKSLKYLSTKLDITDKFNDGFKDALLAAMEVYYVGEKAGEPSVERVNPMEFFYDASPDIEFIHEAQWCARRMFLTPQEIHDRFYGIITDSEKAEIEKIARYSTYDTAGKTLTSETLGINTRLGGEITGSTRNCLEVWHVCWHSYKKILFVTLIDENGEMVEFQADEDYVITGEEVYVETEWATETREGYIAGGEVYFGCRPIPNQYVNSETLNATRLPYTGAIYYNTNSTPKSFASFIEPLQYYAIMIWYRIELQMARDKGKVYTMDMTQIPKSWDMGVSKWLHMINALGINLVNPYETGWDVPSRAGGQRADFNQFSSHDLSSTESILGYIQVLEKVERMAEALTGVTPQRKGDIKSNELVGNVYQSIERSANITASLFGKHRRVTREVLKMLLNTAQCIWAINPPAALNYVFEDGERVFLQLTDDFFHEDFDLFITDSRAEKQSLDEMKGLYQAAMQNGASLLDVAEIMVMDNISEIKNKLREIETTKQEREEQMAQAERENQMAIADKQREIQEMIIADKEADRDLEAYKVDADNMTKIQVAQINAYRYQEDLDSDGDGIPDPMQIGELSIKQQQQHAKEREVENSRRLKQKEITSKEKQQDKKIKADIELQKQKDDAAMAREKLKSETALKNPVAGEKTKKKK